MNPQRDYRDADPQVVRMFIQLFVHHGDQFQFSIDGGVSEDEEVRADVIPKDHDHDGVSTITITAINEKDRFEAICDAVREMGGEMVEEKVMEGEVDGEHRRKYVAVVSVPEDADGDWNVPHLLVYGSLSPEIEEACHDGFGSNLSFENIRNHYVIFGNELPENAKPTLADAIRRSRVFDDMKQDRISDANRGELV